MDHGRFLTWMSDGSELFEQTLALVSDPGMTEPSLLAGWTRAHVAVHVARNADALCNLLLWARTGVETPMYSSSAERADGIARASDHAPADIRADVVASAARLADAVAGLPADAWSATVRTARGRAVPAAEVLWMRTREVWVHAVDLDAATSFADVPLQLAVALLSDALGGVTEDLGLRIVATDAAFDLTLGAPAVTVAATAAELLPWVLGRSPGGAGWPPLPPWL